ncbi:MAG: hypothetical protein LIP11_08730 [Clostridiales bacterium]|nr:hypothetical protein [Clostridiales bacterium]
MSDRLNFIIKTKEGLIEAIHQVGFLPVFQNSLPGFSVEDHVDPSIWFTDETGVWEWKGPVIQEANCAYGKFFENRAAFISAEWFLDFANYRRDGYDFDARFDDELASYKGAGRPPAVQRPQSPFEHHRWGWPARLRSAPVGEYPVRSLDGMPPGEG